MKQSNENSWRPLFHLAISYILALKDEKNTPIVNSKARTGFVAFLIAIHSFEGIYEDYIQSGKLDFLLTFKWSQDHLETFFALVRASLGCNNNPSVRQFHSIMKRLLVHNEIRGGRGQNCELDDECKVLTVPSTNKRPKPNIITDEEDICDIDLSVVTILNSTTDYKKAVITYISGYVVKMAEKILTCDVCALALHSTKVNTGSHHQLLIRKEYGQLVYACEDVIFICQVTEAFIARMSLLSIAASGSIIPSLLTKVLQKCMEQRN
jgi:hypothetical protein